MKLVMQLALPCLLLTLSPLYSSPFQSRPFDCSLQEQKIASLYKELQHKDQDISEIFTIYREVAKDNKRLYTIIDSLKLLLANPYPCRGPIEELGHEINNLKKKIDQLNVDLSQCKEKSGIRRSEITGGNTDTIVGSEPNEKLFSSKPDFRRIQPQALLLGNDTLSSATSIIALTICGLFALFLVVVFFIGMRDRWRQYRWKKRNPF